MGYAPIKAIKFQNFRNLKDVVIEFDGHSVITLVGDNDAGKSSMSKAMETLGANLNPNIQKDYIRAGTSGFLVAVLLDDEDETVIYRRKAPGFNGFGVQKKGNNIWSTDKMDENNVPPQVKEYMGFILEPETKELLNVRTYENLLLFIMTSGSSNYKVMYNALKADSIAKAIKLGTQEANEYKRDIGKAETSIEALTEQLRSIRLVDLGPLMLLKKRLEDEQSSLVELENAENLCENITRIDRELGALSSLTDVELIDEVEAETLNSLSGVLNDLEMIESKIKIYNEAETFKEIDINELNMLDTCINLLTDLESKNYEAYDGIRELEGVDEEEVRLLNSSFESLHEIERLDKEYSRYGLEYEMVTDRDIAIINNITAGLQGLVELEQLDGQITAVNKVVDELETQLKSFGVLVTTCRNCGETVIMEPQ